MCYDCNIVMYMFFLLDIWHLLASAGILLVGDRCMLNLLRAVNVFMLTFFSITKNVMQLSLNIFNILFASK